VNVFLYMILLSIGVVFGSFYSLAIYRIPKKQDIVRTHSYCPKCSHKLFFLDLIPVLSYVFLRGKCRHCGDKIRPRYLILEIISGVAFVVMAYLTGIEVYSLDLLIVLNYAFLVLYFTYVVIAMGTYLENKKIDKPVHVYGVAVLIMYIVYLCVLLWCIHRVVI